MAYHRKKRYNTKSKRSYQRKRKGAKSSIKKGVGKGKIGNSIVFPPRKYVTFTATGADTFVYDGFGGLKFTTIRANNPRDPLYPTGGPGCNWYQTLTGADQGHSPYTKLRCLGSRLKVTFLSLNSTSGALSDICIYARDESELSISDVADFYTKQYAKAAVLGSGYSSRGVKTLKYALNKKQMGAILGIKDIATDDQTMMVYSGDPAKEILYDIFVSPMLSNSTAEVQIRWVVEYDCELFDVNTYIA